MVENDLSGYDLLLEMTTSSKTKVVGITGPPGAGKSTLVNALLNIWSKSGKKIAVLAVDPSSPFNFGALLGDRIRMSAFYDNPNVYIRSLASRGALGGLNAKILEITDVVKQAPFDYLIIETVGVGQSEVEIAGLADCTIVTLVPEGGDVVQTLKAGIMEIADIFVVNKADRELSETLYRNLRNLVHEKATTGLEIPVVKVIATDSVGVEELTEKIDQFFVQKHSNDRKLQMLTEKAWQLIQKRHMKKYHRQALLEELKVQSLKPQFNLYAFIDNYVSNIH
ncbi:MAG: AAA family ATPase [Bacteroidetes bacterium]|nr:AAA family ATPase [Bacteroidota bacterium]